MIGKAPVSSPSHMRDEEGGSGEWSALVAKLWPGGVDAQVGKGRVIASDKVEAALGKIGVAPDFRFNGANGDVKIPFVHRRDAKGDIYYLVNQQNTAQSIEAHFRVAGKKPEMWYAETGATEPVSY